MACPLHCAAVSGLRCCALRSMVGRTAAGTLTLTSTLTLTPTLTPTLTLTLALTLTLTRLLLSFDQCFAAHVRTIVLMVGINNLLGARPQHGVESEGKPAPPQEVGAAIQRLVRRLHAS